MARRAQAIWKHAVPFVQVIVACPDATLETSVMPFSVIVAPRMPTVASWVSWVTTPMAPKITLL